MRYVGLGLLLWATTCSACFGHARVPFSPRPDTRLILGVVVDSGAFQRSLHFFQVALPNETAVCYGGALRDTTIGRTGYVLHLTEVRQALIDSTDQFHVYFSGHGVVENCAHPVAIGHSHPYATVTCDHSADDAMLLFHEPEALASLVWCRDGRFQVLFQDGRRLISTWRE